jgi:hypothetical protein
MSNSRSFRRRLAGSKQKRPRFPAAPPALSTVHGWMRQAKAEGLIEPKGTRRTGKRGRPPVLWGLTPAGRERAASSGPHQDQAST